MKFLASLVAALTLLFTATAAEAQKTCFPWRSIVLSCGLLALVQQLHGALAALAQEEVTDERVVEGQYLPTVFWGL